MTCSIENYWSTQTFAHDCNRLIQYRRNKCIVADSCIDLLGAEEGENLSNEIGGISYRGEGEDTAFESIRDRQKYVLAGTCLIIELCTMGKAALVRLTPLTVCLSKVTVGLSTMNVPSTTGTKTNVP